MGAKKSAVERFSERESRHRSSKKNSGGEMIYFEDRGSVLDAPIDVVWDFILKDNVYHLRAHQASLRNMKWKDLNEITGEGACEVLRGGKWRKMKFRVTTIPPHVRIVEEFGGRYDGQKFVLLYTPKGRNKTAVDVFVYTRKRVAKEMRETLEKSHLEDLPMLREFARKQRNYLGNVNSLIEFKPGKSGFRKTSEIVDKVLVQAYDKKK